MSGQTVTTFQLEGATTMVNKRNLAFAAVAAPAATLATPISAQALDDVPEQKLTVEDLSPDQREAFEAPKPVEVKGSEPSESVATRASAYRASRQRRASYHRGSWLMWTRDNVHFSYDWRRVRWANAYQNSGAVFPNRAKNLGSWRYMIYRKTKGYRFKNQIGAGVPTPWGGVKLYTKTYTHRIVVRHHGGWSAWSE